MRRATLSGVPALALALVMSVATARAATSIHPDTTPGLGLGTTVTVKGSVYTINNGTRVGSNLFESFSDFSLAVGATARWTYTASSAAGITDVISRVTGGSPSQISGTLDSTALPGAAFYFINPAGIVFGAGAAVKVPGAAHFSTARQLVFADGAVFTATTATGSALTMAPPSAFGFLGGEGDIVLDGVGRGFAETGGSLSLAAADLAISSSSVLAGHLDLIAVGSQALTVPMAAPLTASAIDGSLTVTGSTLVAQSSATIDGAVQMGGGDVSLVGGSSVRTTSPAGTTGGGPLTVTARSLSMNDSTLTTTTSGLGAAGAIGVAVAGDLVMANGSSIDSDTKVPGNAGSISVSSQTLSMAASQILSISLQSTGATGSVTVAVGGGATMSDSSTISSTASDGNVGAVTMTAQSLSMDDSDFDSNAAGSGTAGAVDIQVAGALQMTDGAFVHSTTFGSGNAGAINLKAQSLFLDDGNIGGNSLGSGNAGSIIINIGDGFVMQDNSVIASQNNFSGLGGTVLIMAQSFSMSNSSINTSTYGPGNAGTVTFEISDGMSMTNLSTIHSASHGIGDGEAGNVNIKASSLTLESISQIVTSSSNADAGGVIVVNAGNLLIDGVNTVIASDNISSVGGVGGAISVTSNHVVLSNGGEIITNSTAGKAGNISLDFPDGGLLILEGVQPGTIRTNSATDLAGEISIINPSAIILNGSDIEAVGPFLGAFVVFQTPAVVESSDRINIIDVTGNFTFNGEFADISGSVTLSDLSFVDASKVLRAQCAAQSATGEASRLITRLNGPYQAEPEPVPATRGDGLSWIGPTRPSCRMAVMAR